MHATPELHFPTRAHPARRIDDDGRSSDERLNLALHGTSDGLWDWNVKTGEVYYSPRFVQELGYAQDELEPTIETFHLLIHPDDLAPYFKAVTEHFKGHAPSYNMEYRLRHKDGHYLWCNARGQALFDAQQQATRMTGFTTNISRRKAAEAEREKLVDTLVKSNAALERFAYIASHDMQEPLRMIASFSTLIVEEAAPKLGADCLDYLDIVIESSQRMQRMVADLLDYSRLEGENEQKKLINASEEMEYVLANMATHIRECHATVTCEPLPMIQANPVQFVRLMQNLIGNALKYQAPGARPNVKISVIKREREWLFSVRDNGIGIASEHTDEIFQPFRRLHAWSHYKGTGIGLAICKKIVESHGGRIWATPAAGGGSVFYFTLPEVQ